MTHASVRDALPGVTLAPGMVVVVGNEEADPAVAEVVSIDARGIVLIRVFPGPADDHLTLGPRESFFDQLSVAGGLRRHDVLRR